MSVYVFKTSSKKIAMIRNDGLVSLFSFLENHLKITRSKFGISNDVVLQLVVQLFQQPPDKNWLIKRLLKLEIKLARNGASL